MVERLGGGNMNAVLRDGDTVLRQSGPWSPSVHALLDHLRAAGVHVVPQPLGIDLESRRERLGYLAGHVPVYPLPSWIWSESVLTSGARLLRAVHDASASFSTAGRSWQQAAREPAEVVCHNDFAPHNLVFDDRHAIVGVIDWDMCSPGPRLHDLAVFATRAVPLTADPPADAPQGAGVRRRIQTILEAYGSDASVEELLAQAVSGLRFLADYSREAAIRLGKPELTQHAAQYERDARALETGDVAGAPA